MTAPDRIWIYEGPDGVDWQGFEATGWPEYVRADVANELAQALGLSLTLMEENEVQIDGEWGLSRTLDQIDREGDLPEAIITARAALARYRGGA